MIFAAWQLDRLYSGVSLSPKNLYNELRCNYRIKGIFKRKKSIRKQFLTMLLNVIMSFKLVFFVNLTLVGVIMKEVISTKNVFRNLVCGYINECFLEVIINVGKFSLLWSVLFPDIHRWSLLQFLPSFPTLQLIYLQDGL